MKILLLIDNLNSGGAQNQIKNLAIGLKRDGKEVRLLCYSAGSHFEKELKENAIPCHRILKKGRFDLFLPLKIHQYCKREKITHIVAYLFTPSFYALVCKILAPQRYVIVSERSFVKKSIYADFTRFWYFKADHIVANSFHQMVYLKQRFTKLEHKISHIPNGIQWVDSLDKAVHPSEKFTIICVGRVQQIKNTHLIIQLLHQLISVSKLNIQVNWVGAGDQMKLGEIDPYYKECVARIENLNLQDNWRWWGRREDVISLMQQSDLLIHASSGEGFPNVILEAMSCGCVVLASDFGDHPRVIQNGVNGFIFKQHDLDDLIEKTQGILHLEKKEKLEVTISARKTIKEHYTIAKMTSHYLKLLV